MSAQPGLLATSSSEHGKPRLCPSCEVECRTSQMMTKFLIKDAVRYCELCRLIVSSSLFAKLLLSDPLKSCRLSLFALVDLGTLKSGSATWTDDQIQAWACSMATKPSLFRESPNYIPGWLRPARSDLTNFTTNIARSLVVHFRLPNTAFTKDPVKFKVESNAMRAGDSGESVDWLRRRLHECDQSHVSCHSRYQSSDHVPPRGFPSPVRFIRVDEYTPRLVEIQEDIPKFLALSHRWGSSGNLKTTKQNIDSHMVEIPIDLLPKTFRDVVHLAARLDVPYVWIDSLCIIQDNELDWIGQSRQMGQIFESAYLTVAAVDAWVNSDVDGGLFMARDMAPIRAEITSTLHMSYNRIEKSEDGEFAFFNGDEAVDIHAESDRAWKELTCNMEKRLTPFLTSVENSDWNSRGWVFQERMMSSRIVYFTKEQLFWECRQDMVPEQAASTSVRHVDDFSARNVPQSTRLHGLIIDATLLKGQQPPLEVRLPTDTPFGGGFWDVWDDYQKFKVWWQLAERYSECELTKKSDKWWALAGLATSLSYLYGSRLQAGIWESAPGMSLLWHVRGRPLARLDHDFIAPSWSWLSVDGPIAYAYRDHSYPKAIQKVQPLLREPQFRVVEVARERGDGGMGNLSTSYGFTGTISFLSPTKAAMVSDMRLEDFSFSEVTGRHRHDQSAFEFLDEVSGGRSGMELMIELRAEKNLPPHCRLLTRLMKAGQLAGLCSTVRILSPKRYYVLLYV